jgi:hypothetical protein
MGRCGSVASRLRLGYMTNVTEPKLHRVLRLAQTSFRRSRTLQMTIRDWSLPSKIERAQGLAAREAGDLPPHEDRLEVSFDLSGGGPSLRQKRLDRVRIETRLSIAAAISDNWWIYDKQSGDLRTGVGDLGAETDLWLHFPDVSWLRRPGVVVRGHADVAGRTGVLLTVPAASMGFGMTPGADSYRLVVDAERGFLLRAEAVLNGEVIAIEEAEAIVLDARLPDDVFVPPRAS